jgi:hypothetical protein
MNCKPGDLAVIVRSAAGNEGKIVHCVRLAGEKVFLDSNLNRVGPFICWEVSPPMICVLGNVQQFFADEFLRPIRDNDGTDETLTWAPKREGIEA